MLESNEMPSFAFLHLALIKSSDISKESTASIYHMFLLVQAGGEMLRWKKMCRLYRKVSDTWPTKYTIKAMGIPQDTGHSE